MPSGGRLPARWCSWHRSQSGWFDAIRQASPNALADREIEVLRDVAEGTTDAAIDGGSTSARPRSRPISSAYAISGSVRSSGRDRSGPRRRCSRCDAPPGRLVAALWFRLANPGTGYGLQNYNGDVVLQVSELGRTMKDFTRSLDIMIDAPVHEVFEYCRDPHHLFEGWPALEVTDGRDHTGGSGHQGAHRGPVRQGDDSRTGRA